MKIDNSRAKTWHACPWKYRERYIHNIEPKFKAKFFGFGTRVHELLEHRLLGTAAPPAESEFEAECQTMLAAYEAHYPVEPFEVIASERYVEVPLPNSSHIYIAKIDGIVRAHDTGMLNILEHKTEKRGGKQNLPEAWAARPQVALYLWAAEQIYGEKVDQIILDVLTRQSPAGREPASFSRQHLQRSSEQITDALANITWAADQIERMTEEFKDRPPAQPWPFDGEQCASGFFKCDYYKLHVFGRSEELLEAEFAEAEEYLAL